MKGNILKRLDRLDKKLADLILVVEALSEEARVRKPSPGAWSVLQVMEHLRMAEAHSGVYIRKKALSMDSLPSKDLACWYRELALGFFLRTPLKFKAPEIVNEESFPDDLSLREQSESWLRQRADLKAWLAEQPSEYFKLQGYRHPLAGRMTVHGMLKFFEWHFDRHRKQIDRTIRKVRG